MRFSRCSFLAAALAPFCAALPSAEAQVPQPGTQPAGEEGGIAIPVQSSLGCRNCHGGYAPLESDDYEPYDAWRGSLMGSGARDPVVLAAVAIAEEDHPDAVDFCLRCHTPAAWLSGRSSLPEYDLASPSYPERLRPDGNDALSTDRDGIACMVCHRMVEPPDPAMISNAQLVLADGTEGGVRRGPYAYELGEEPRHETVVEPFLSSGELCGSCHDIHNPLHDGFRMPASGVGAPEPTGRRFVIERTYTEWRHSAFPERGQTCQTCHMPTVEAYAADGAVNLRPAMNRHDLAGASIWVPRAIAAMVRDLDPEAALHLEAGSHRAEEMLRAAATLTVTDVEMNGSTATATVNVTNDSGHKLPTGYPEGRRMWLTVEVLDEADRVVAGSGRYDEVTGVLERDAQLRTYEVKLGEAGVESFHFVLNDTLMSDTRIPPAGFDPPAELDAAPLGRDYTTDEGSFRHWDETTYSLAGLCGSGTLRLLVRLRFLATTPEYIEFLRDEAPPSTDPAFTGRSWGQIAYDAWREHGGDEPFDMETFEVELGASPRPCPEPDAGMPDAGSAPDAGHDGGASDHEDAGSAPAAPTGCGCRVAPGSSPIGGLALLSIAAIALTVRRRRAR